MPYWNFNCGEARVSSIYTSDLAGTTLTSVAIDRDLRRRDSSKTIRRIPVHGQGITLACPAALSQVPAGTSKMLSAKRRFDLRHHVRKSFHRFSPPQEIRNRFLGVHQVDFRDG